jgi:FkbM family methyltransferase
MAANKTQHLYDWTIRPLAKHRRSRGVLFAAKVSRVFLDGYHNLDYVPEFNGEYALLQRLTALPVPTIFDVGANVGEWSTSARAIFPSANIHAFEILPQTYAELSSKNGFTKINCGLSDEAGDVDLRSFEGDSGLTTMFDYPHPNPKPSIRCRVMRGDSYMRDNNIARIDFLKIDVEGAEHKVLAGFSDAFARKAIDMVQFEYGRVNIITKFLLRDFYQFFDGLGFVVGKLYPTYVDFRPYTLQDEDFRGPNYIACRKDLSENIAILSGRT